MTTVQVQEARPEQAVSGIDAGSALLMHVSGMQQVGGLSG